MAGESSTKEGVTIGPSAPSPHGVPSLLPPPGVSPVPGSPQADAVAKENMAKNPSLYRALHHLNRGGLHRALGVPEGQDIPKDRIEAAKNSNNSHVAHMANFASTMGGFNHKK